MAVIKMSLFNCLAIILLASHQGVFSLPTNNLQSFSPYSSRQTNYPIESASSSSSLSSENDKPIYAPETDILGSSYEPDPIISNLDDSENNEISNEIDSDDTDTDIYRKLVEEIKTEEDIAIKSAYLMKMLQDSVNGPLPVVYVEEPKSILGVNKRSGRYYRRYPWKRQNSRNRTTYEADSRYLCVPSREDVFKLLVGLHENRNGNQQKQVKFCNRKRPAKVIFTNIRFLG